MIENRIEIGGVMRKVYLDTTQADMCISVYVNGAEVVLAGAAVNAMSVKHKNKEYQKFAEEYDIHFIFADDAPKVDFYTVPMVDIFAVDSAGGYIGSMGQPTDLEADIPICYIDIEKRCYLIAANGKELLNKANQWKEHLTPCANVEFFESFEMAQEKYEFLDRAELERELRNVVQNQCMSIEETKNK